jgi:general stress protein YciG
MSSQGKSKPSATTAKKKLRGFAALTPAERSEISRKGGRSAHWQGTAHEWTRDEAVKAGRKGGKASRANAIARGVDVAGPTLSSDDADELAALEEAL